ncbi:dihydrolipoyllysine-residue acetyltransferase component of pyruvate dehydrogenase complex [Thalassobacillus devorans]|uniref:Dihydrolipoamide acetyltransferase component of pyruvate dehydrogenase complex n=1 Tax=Thalassobacillus devorans TaxID=279813 RepID=A0ABQ1P1S1_9BACI|nr:dihydrolipoamide acetyltransferase family protein [Thalassobacillus devorans]NIK28043.1 pyruvate dehydrogenase E2 component (dihydrolipoamide acetyltransferase) [Thalassobacillus devorans]GGC89322.1 dihydrolipoyllysine-residue acetyltransferase component of pyruvate dehydrogenase complex [Thalassobacillus devorans]
MYEVKMPRLGVTMQKGTINQWLVEEGEEVNKGDYIFEMETEKSTLEIEAQESGTLKKVIVPDGEEVAVNTVVAIIADLNEEVDLSAYLQDTNQEKAVGNNKEKSTSSTATAVRKQRSKVVPKARKLAKEMGLSLEEIQGTGKDGLITVNDVKSFVNFSEESQLTVKETIPLNHVKRAMSNNVLESWQTVPQFTQMVSVNMENVLKVKKQLEGITLNDLLIKSLAKAAASYPIVNSQFDKDKKVKIFEEVNISVAVNSSHGLVVPVLRNVPSKSIHEVSKEMKEIGYKAEASELTPQDYADGTITLSNLGSVGIESGTPIINTPQSTIVFAGTIKKTPIVNKEDEVIVAPIMTLSICYDHRFIDGVTGAEFTNQFKTILEKLSVEDITT